MTDKEILLTITEVCHVYAIPQSVLEEWVAFGLFAATEPFDGLLFNAVQLNRIAKAMRLFHVLELNSAGVILAMELLDQIESLERELAIARRLQYID